MALNSNPFDEGIDPTSTFGGYASVLLQLIREAKPSSTYGMILFDTTAPDVTEANAWRKRSIWINFATPSLPTVNVYREGGSPGWVNVNDVISANTITTAMIQNLAVTLAKLSPAGGTANQLIRVNAGATAFEFVSLSSLVVAGSINVNSLITTGIPAGQFRLVGTYGPGVATWYDAQQVVNNLANAAIPTDLLTPAPSPTTRSKFLTGRVGDVYATWRFFEPNTDILDTTLSGGKLQNGTVSPVKVESAGIPDGYLLGKVAGVPDWVAPPVIPVAPMTREFAYITGAIAGLGNSGERQLFVGTALGQPTTNAQWNSAAGEYTALNTGYFKITACIHAEGAGSTSNIQIRLKKNGSLLNQTNLVDLLSSVSSEKTAPIVLTHIEKVTTASTDVFELFGYIQDIHNVNIIQYSSFTIERIDTL